jgi:hypothetical protein
MRQTFPPEVAQLADLFEHQTPQQVIIWAVETLRRTLR